MSAYSIPWGPVVARARFVILSPFNASDFSVCWCFEPSQPQRITSGLNANFILFPSYSFHKSWYYKSCFFVVFFWPIYMPRALNMGTCIQQCDLFYSAGLYRNEKIGRGFWKHAGEWTGRVEINKKSLAVSIACMAIYWPTPGFKGRTFKHCFHQMGL